MRWIPVALLVLWLGALARATFTPAGVTHHNLIGVLEQTSPTTDTTDRALMTFKASDGNTYVVYFKASNATVAVVNLSGSAITTTTTTTTSTTTTTTTTTTLATTTTTTTTSTTTTT